MIVCVLLVMLVLTTGRLLASVSPISVSLATLSDKGLVCLRYSARSLSVFSIFFTLSLNTLVSLQVCNVPSTIPPFPADTLRPLLELRLSEVSAICLLLFFICMSNITLDTSRIIVRIFVYLHIMSSIQANCGTIHTLLDYL